MTISLRVTAFNGEKFAADIEIDGNETPFNGLFHKTVNGWQLLAPNQELAENSSENLLKHINAAAKNVTNFSVKNIAVLVIP